MRAISVINPLLIGAAVIPAVLLLIYVYKKDKLEKESRGFLWSLIAFGFLAMAAAIVTELTGEAFLSAIDPSYSTYLIIDNFLIIALSEEGFKFLFLKIRTWKSPQFNCQFDGVVYSVFVALGFAVLENIIYVVGYGFSAALIRAVTAVPGHACFGVFMGVFYGMARRHANNGQAGKARLCRALAIVLPTLLHGTYDYAATIASEGKDWIFIGFVVVMFGISWFLVRKSSREDQFI